MIKFMFSTILVTILILFSIYFTKINHFHFLYWEVIFTNEVSENYPDLSRDDS